MADIKNRLIEIVKQKWKSNYALCISAVFISSFFVYYDFGVRLFIGYLLAGALLGIGIIKSGFVFKPKITITKLSFFVFCVVVTAMSLSPRAYLEEDAKDYIVALWFSFIFLLFADSRKSELKHALGTFTVAGSVFAFYIFFVKIFPTFFWNRIYPYMSASFRTKAAQYIPQGYGVPIGSSLVYSDYIMAVALFIVICYVFTQKTNVKEKIISGIAAGVFLAGMLVEGRRGEVVAVLLSAFAVSLIYIFSNEKKKAIRYGLILLGIVIVAFLLCLALSSLSFMSRYINTVKGLFVSKNDVQLAKLTSGRSCLWHGAWQIFLEHPVFGIGWGQFPNFGLAEYIEVYQGKFVSHCHNDYLNVLCENGIFGFLLVFAPVVFNLVNTIKYFVRVLKEKSKNRIPAMTLGISFAIQVFFILLSIIDPCLYKLQYLSIYIIALMLYTYTADDKIIIKRVLREHS